MQKQKIFSAFTTQHQRLNFAGDGRKLEEEEGRRGGGEAIERKE